MAYYYTNLLKNRNRTNSLFGIILSLSFGIEEKEKGDHQMLTNRPFY